MRGSTQFYYEPTSFRLTEVGSDATEQDRQRVGILADTQGKPAPSAVFSQPSAP